MHVSPADAASQSKELTACEQERPRTINLRLLRPRLARLIADTLNVAELSAWPYGPNQSRPSAAYRGLVFAPKQTLIHPPRKRVGKEGCPAGLRAWPAVRIQQARAPIAIRSLQAGDPLRHLLKEGDEPRSPGILRRQVLQ